MLSQQRETLRAQLGPLTIILLCTDFAATSTRSMGMAKELLCTDIALKFLILHQSPSIPFNIQFYAAWSFIMCYYKRKKKCCLKKVEKSCTIYCEHVWRWFFNITYCKIVFV